MGTGWPGEGSRSTQRSWVTLHFNGSAGPARGLRNQELAVFLKWIYEQKIRNGLIFIPVWRSNTVINRTMK